MIINEHRYSKEDTVNALEAYYSFFTKTVIMHYAPLPIAAVCGYLYYTSGLKRFVVFAIIFLLLFLMRYAQIALGAKYDAMRMNEETGRPDPLIRYEIGDDIKVFRQGQFHVSIPLTDIVGAKQKGADLAVFTRGNYTLYFKADHYLEGGETQLKALVRAQGANVK